MIERLALLVVKGVVVREVRGAFYAAEGVIVAVLRLWNWGVDIHYGCGAQVVRVQEKRKIANELEFVKRIGQRCRNSRCRVINKHRPVGRRQLEVGIGAGWLECWPRQLRIEAGSNCIAVLVKSNLGIRVGC